MIVPCSLFYLKYAQMIGLWRCKELLFLFLIAFFFVPSTDTAKSTRANNNQQNKKLETQLTAFESQVSPNYYFVTTICAANNSTNVTKLRTGEGSSELGVCKKKQIERKARSTKLAAATRWRLSATRRRLSAARRRLSAATAEYAIVDECDPGDSIST